MLHALNRGATSVIPAVPENERNQTNIKFVSSAEDFKGIADMRSQDVAVADLAPSDGVPWILFTNKTLPT